MIPQIIYELLPIHSQLRVYVQFLTTAEIHGSRVEMTPLIEMLVSFFDESVDFRRIDARCPRRSYELPFVFRPEIVSHNRHQPIFELREIVLAFFLESVKFVFQRTMVEHIIDNDGVLLSDDYVPNEFFIAFVDVVTAVGVV